MKKYNVGIIGYGWVAGAHIGAINASPYAQVSAVYSSRELDSAKISAQHGSRITAYEDLKKMLANPDIDVVSICSYPYDSRWQAGYRRGARREASHHRETAGAFVEGRSRDASRREKSESQDVRMF